jgi:glycosyltransferase involved in cell wall biosynthesis
MKLAVLVNMIAPSRLPIYSGLAAHFDLLLLHGGTESNRDSWRDLESKLPGVRIRQAWGWQIRLPRKQNGQVFDQQFTHVTPGYLWHLLRFRPDAVITNEMGFRTLTALAYGTLLRKPVWVWWGGTLHTERRIGRIKRALRSLIARWARHWISYGQTSTEYLASLGIPADRILQIQNAVDECPFAVAVEPQFHLPVQPVLLYVGQFIARKGVDLLLTAAAALQREGREFSLLLVGSGPDKQALEQRAAALNLSNVFFRPSLSPDQIPAVYRSGDALIFPTLEDPWGLVANEAMLSGLPVLCSRYAGCAPELFPPESIFDPENPSEFVEKLRQALDDRLPKPDLSRLMTVQQVLNDLVGTLKQFVPARVERLSAASTAAPVRRS